MRYHSNLPILSTESATQRARPTCMLSLDNVSACSTVDPIVGYPNAMQVDLPTSSILTAVEAKPNAIPFPATPRNPRKHYLLRSSLKLSVASLKSPPSEDSQEPPSPTELAPPRKRTRTSALSSPATPHRHRVSSVPINRPSTTLPPPPRAPLLFSGSPSSPPRQSTPLPNPHEPFKYAFPTISTTSVSPPSSSISNSNSQVSSSPDAPVLSFRRRRPTAGEVKVLIYVYRSLVYGLIIKYLRGSVVVEDQPIGESCPNPFRVTVGSELDVQDARLAEYLKDRLLASGADIHSMTVDVDEVAAEATCHNPSARTQSSPTSLHLPHLHASASGSIISYQQLVASLLLRHRMHPRRSQAKSLGYKGRNRRRQHSTLAECVSIFTPVS